MEKIYNDENAKELLDFINSYMGKIKYIESKEKRIIKLSDGSIIDLCNISSNELLDKIRLGVLISELSGNFKTLYVSSKEKGFEISNQIDIKDPKNNILYVILNEKDGLLDSSSKLLLSCLLNTELLNWDSLFLTSKEKNGLKIFKDFKVIWFNKIFIKYVQKIVDEQQKKYIDNSEIILERGKKYGKLNNG